MTSNRPSVIFVSGNRSGDLDSLVTSYIRSQILSKENPDSEVYTILYFPEDKWKLHRDARFLFEQCNADLSHHIHIDDLHEKTTGGDTYIYLTDHNQPEPELKAYSESIVEIIDHHKVLTPIAPQIRQVIDHTGSCSTLIWEKWNSLIQARPDLFSREQIRSIAEMLYFTIRIDTDHLPDGEMYNLARDRKALAALKQMLGKSENFLEELSRAKNQMDDFSVEDHLSRDYKIWHLPRFAYGISSIQEEIDRFFNLLDSDPDSPERFIKNNDLNILFLMHFNKDPILKRELTVFDTVRCPFTEELVKEISSSSHFNRFDDAGKGYYRFAQSDPHLSRKKIQPLLSGILSKLTDKE